MKQALSILFVFAITTTTLIGQEVVSNSSSAIKNDIKIVLKAAETGFLNIKGKRNYGNLLPTQKISGFADNTLKCYAYDYIPRYESVQKDRIKLKAATKETENIARQISAALPSDYRLKKGEDSRFSKRMKNEFFLSNTTKSRTIYYFYHPKEEDRRNNQFPYIVLVQEQYKRFMERRLYIVPPNAKHLKNSKQVEAEWAASNIVRTWKKSKSNTEAFYFDIDWAKNTMKLQFSYSEYFEIPMNAGVRMGNAPRRDGSFGLSLQPINGKVQKVNNGSKNPQGSLVIYFNSEKTALSMKKHFETIANSMKK